MGFYFARHVGTVDQAGRSHKEAEYCRDGLWAVAF